MPENKHSPNDLIKSFMAGGLAGCFSIPITYPLDTVKVRLQTVQIPKNGELPIYNGMLDCFKKIIKNEGIFALYKGVSVAISVVTPVWAVYFFGFNTGKRLQLPELSNEKHSYRQIFIAGVFAGAVTSLVVAPSDRVKCLLQMQTSNKTREYNGTIDCIRKLYKQNGFRALFKGTLATLAKDAPASGVYFTTYEYLKNFLTGLQETTATKLNPIAIIFAGGSAGMANWIIAMPSDTVKTRFQTAPEGKYKNYRHVISVLIKAEGLGGFYKGFLPVIVRTFPSNAACLLGYEIIIKFLDKLF